MFFIIIFNCLSTCSTVQLNRELFCAISNDEQATPPALTACAGPNKTPFLINTSIASIVHGILAPSATTLTLLFTNIFAAVPSISFCVAHGKAISHGTDQMSLQLSKYSASG